MGLAKIRVEAVEGTLSRYQDLPCAIESGKVGCSREYRWKVEVGCWDVLHSDLALPLFGSKRFLYANSYVEAAFKANLARIVY